MCACIIMKSRIHNLTGDNIQAETAQRHANEKLFLCSRISQRSCAAGGMAVCCFYCHSSFSCCCVCFMVKQLPRQPGLIHQFICEESISECVPDAAARSPSSLISSALLCKGDSFQSALLCSSLSQHKNSHEQKIRLVAST